MKTQMQTQIQTQIQTKMDAQIQRQIKHIYKEKCSLSEWRRVRTRHLCSTARPNGKGATRTSAAMLTAADIIVGIQIQIQIQIHNDWQQTITISGNTTTNDWQTQHNDWQHTMTGNTRHNDWQYNTQ